LTIAKFDATENDIPASAGFKVQGFPTISKHPLVFSERRTLADHLTRGLVEFKAAGSKEWVSYEGDRSLDSFVEFLESNATNDIATADEPEAELDGETTIKSDRHDELVSLSLTYSSLFGAVLIFLFFCSK